MTPAEIMASALAEEILSIAQKLMEKKNSSSISLSTLWHHCHEVHHITGPEYRESMNVLKKSGRIKKSDEAGKITFI